MSTYCTIATFPCQFHRVASLDILGQGGESDASADGGDKGRAQKEGLCELHGY